MPTKQSQKRKAKEERKKKRRAARKRAWTRFKDTVAFLYDLISGWIGAGKEYIKQNLGKLSIGLLIVTCIALGTRGGCGYSKKTGIRCNLGYTPPDAGDVREIISTKEVVK